MTWTYEKYWDVVFGPERDAVAVAADAGLLGPAAPTVNEFLNEAEARAARELGLLAPPDAWAAFYGAAWLELATAVEAWKGEAPVVAGEVDAEAVLREIRRALAQLEDQDAEEQYATLMHVSECFEELDRALTSRRARLPQEWAPVSPSCTLCAFSVGQY